MITGLVLYIPANVLPVLQIERYGSIEKDTILGGVLELVHYDLWPLAVIVFMASVVVPLAKLFGLAWLLWQTGRRSPHQLRQRTRIYRLIDTIGRWSNIDVFMISILGALVQFGALERVRPENGALAFAGVVLHHHDCRAVFRSTPHVAHRHAAAGAAHMTDEQPQPPEAAPQAQRVRRRLSVVWLAPAFAVAVMAWLSWQR